MSDRDDDCFGRGYLKNHAKCNQCVMITEYNDFRTGVLKRNLLRVVCKETCDHLKKIRGNLVE